MGYGRALGRTLRSWTHRDLEPAWEVPCEGPPEKKLEVISEEPHSLAEASQVSSLPSSSAVARRQRPSSAPVRRRSAVSAEETSGAAAAAPLTSTPIATRRPPSAGSAQRSGLKETGGTRSHVTELQMPWHWSPVLLDAKTPATRPFATQLSPDQVAASQWRTLPSARVIEESLSGCSSENRNARKLKRPRSAGSVRRPSAVGMEEPAFSGSTCANASSSSKTKMRLQAAVSAAACAGPDLPIPIVVTPLDMGPARQACGDAVVILPARQASELRILAQFTEGEGDANTPPPTMSPPSECECECESVLGVEELHWSPKEARIASCFRGAKELLPADQEGDAVEYAGAEATVVNTSTPRTHLSPTRVDSSRGSSPSPRGFGPCESLRSEPSAWKRAVPTALAIETPIGAVEALTCASLPGNSAGDFSLDPNAQLRSSLAPSCLRGRREDQQESSPMQVGSHDLSSPSTASTLLATGLSQKSFAAWNTAIVTTGEESLKIEMGGDCPPSTPAEEHREANCSISASPVEALAEFHGLAASLVEGNGQEVFSVGKFEQEQGESILAAGGGGSSSSSATETPQPRSILRRASSTFHFAGTPPPHGNQRHRFSRPSSASSLVHCLSSQREAPQGNQHPRTNRPSTASSIGKAEVRATGAATFATRRSQQSEALLKSEAFQSSLKDLRRAGLQRNETPSVMTATPMKDSTCARRELSPSPAKAQEVSVPEDRMRVLMERTLADTQDTPEQLQCRVAELQDGAERAGSSGRHPTLCISSRTLAVAERKLELVSELVKRTEAYEVVCSRRSEVLRACAKSAVQPEDLVGDAAGFAKHVRACVHHGGNPQDANKTLFDVFCKSFGLPAQHLAVLRARQLLDEEGILWASFVLREAESIVGIYRAQHTEEVARNELPSGRRPEGAAARANFPERASEGGHDRGKGRDDAQTVQRMIDVAVCLGVPRNHPDLGQAWLRAVEIRVAMVMENVRVEQERNARAAARGDRGQVSTRAAATVEAELKAAQAFGVASILLAGARQAAVDLRAEGALRLAKAEVAALEEGSRPRTAYAAAALQMEGALLAALGAGVPQEHASMVETWSLVKQVREEEALLKRKEARDARERERQAAEEMLLARRREHAMETRRCEVGAG